MSSRQVDGDRLLLLLEQLEAAWRDRREDGTEGSLKADGAERTIAIVRQRYHEGVLAFQAQPHQAPQRYAHRTDEQTSHDAAQEGNVSGRDLVSYRDIIRILRDRDTTRYPHGMLSDEVRRVLRSEGKFVSDDKTPARRMSELTGRDVLMPSGETRVTDLNRRGTVWSINPEADLSSYLE